MAPTKTRSVSMDKDVRRSVIKSYYGRCAATRKYTVTGEMIDCNSKIKLQIDHKHELRHGGTDTYTNLQPLCKTCHVKKSKANRLRQSVWRVIPF